MTPNMSITELFSQEKMVKICAPMVRYSKLEFRNLVRKYGCDLCFTPMIMADSFIKSEKARQNEFTTDESDTPVIVQFAATNMNDFTEAAKLVSPYSSGVDLNCGCPQRWAMKMGLGAHLLSEPETIKNIVLNVRNQIFADYSVSVKIRLLNNAKSTIDLCRQLESAGVTFLTVHGRTKEQRCEPIDIALIKEIACSVQVPVVANGDVKKLQDAVTLQNVTGCKGIMSARGILHNPALFMGCKETPLECVNDWIDISLNSKLHFLTFHHHLVFMLEKILPKCQRKIFNTLSNYKDVLYFLNDYFGFNYMYDLHNLCSAESFGKEMKYNKYFRENTKRISHTDDILFDVLHLYE
ncbi:hypothetical protein RUM44_005134 [Polyplax serrata]|uniref:DUS-like FMN-binding domain-containing protein n=1 Tax=Polyplax serrata TaxID=468196 RepID=A0ABR1AEL2_POLSC